MGSEMCIRDSANTGQISVVRETEAKAAWTDYFSTHGCMRLFSSFAAAVLEEEEEPPLDAAALTAAARALLSKKLIPRSS